MRSVVSLNFPRSLVLLALAALLAASVMMVALARPAQADTYTVTNTGGSGDGSLLQAVNDAAARSGEDKIVFAPSLSGQTITLAQPLFATDPDGLTIDGGSAGITISGGGSTRVFEVDSGGRLTLDNLTVTKGTLLEGGGLFNEYGTVTVRNSTFSGNDALSGGAILNVGTLTVSDSTFSGNGDTEANGGGILNQGTATVADSTFSGNIAGGQGGAILNVGTLTVSNSTLSGNSAATNGGGGIYNGYGTATLRNTIVANSTKGGDCVGATDGGYNLVEDGGCVSAPTSISGKDPLLDPNGLQDNGGPTKTIALLANSPAVDEGIDAAGAKTDQRGQSRPYDFADVANADGGDGSDIGAFELQGPQTYTVNSAADTDDGACTTDAGGCTLREAINAANGRAGTRDTIVFDLGSSATITLRSWLPEIRDGAGLAIDGGTAAITINGYGSHAFTSFAPLTLNHLEVDNAITSLGAIANYKSTLTVTDSTFSGNRGLTGGAIDSTGTLTVSGSTFSGNIASKGGAIDSTGTATVTDSTFSGNIADESSGGAIESSGTLTVSGSTFSGNSAVSGGSGIHNHSGTTTLENTIVADSDPGGNCAGAVTDGGYNLDSGTSCGFSASSNSISGKDPLLDPNGLQDNGGPTKTIALQVGSPAIDKGDSFGAKADQRGKTRPIDFDPAISAPGGDDSDIGAFERQPNNAPTANPQSVATDEDTPKAITLTGSDPDGDALSYAVVSGPSHGTLTGSGASRTYTPAADYNGTDSFTFKTSDGNLDSNVATVSITVKAVNDAPTLALKGGACLSDTVASGRLDFVVADIDSPASSFRLSASTTASNPPSLISSLTTGGNGTDSPYLSLTASPKKSGTATVTVTVSDGSASSTPLPVTVKVGTSNPETITGTGGADAIFGLAGQGTLNGLGGRDLLCGGNGNDVLNGGDDNDVLDGGRGDDALNGGEGNDMLLGNAGRDTLKGEGGDDTLTGGTGADSFSGGAGTDTATDFTPSQGDTKDGTIEQP